MNKRFRYLLAIILTVGAGLLSRQMRWIPLWTGDALYATMMYFIICFLAVKAKPLPVAMFSLCICFGVELSQLYQASWIVNLRATLPGRLVLGQGFLWADLFAYVPGTAAGLLIDLTTIRRYSRGR